MKVSKDLLLPGRVLHETEDHITIEVGKHDGASFSLQRDENGEVVGGDRFYTLMFCHFEDGGMVFWKPWEEEREDG